MNQASLNIAGGALFDAVEAGPTGTMQIDALTGSGSFHGGYFGNQGGLTTLTLGAAGGSGTFSGTLLDDSGAHLAIVKQGSGTQVFSGNNSYTGGTTVTAGTLVIGAAGALPPGSAVVNNASLDIAGNSTAGNLSGTGTTTVAGGVTLNVGSFAQGGLTMQLAGAMAAANAKLNVSGTLTLAGTLTVNLVNNFMPVAGNSFDILDWGSLSGMSFSTVQLPALSGAAMWNTSQLYTSGVLSVVPTFLLGDINRDGKVTVADISALMSALANLNGYQTSDNLTGAQLKLIGDLNGDGHVNNADVQALIALVATRAAGGGGVAAAVH